MTGKQIGGGEYPNRIVNSSHSHMHMRVASTANEPHNYAENIVGHVAQIPQQFGNGLSETIKQLAPGHTDAHQD